MPQSNLWLQDRLPIDDLGARTVIDHAHHEIHEGSHYTCPVYQSLGAASVLSILVTPPSAGSAICHFTGVVISDGSGIVTWSEAPNASAGTALVEYNNNRGSTNTANLAVTRDPTYVSTGTVLIQSPLGTKAPSVNLGGTFAERQEWILYPERLYLLRFTADAASCRTCIIAEWYEET